MAMSAQILKSRSNVVRVLGGGGGGGGVSDGSASVSLLTPLIETDCRLLQPERAGTTPGDDNGDETTRLTD